MVTKMPALYVVDANTKWLYLNASESMYEAGVTEVSYIFTLTPLSQSFEARMFAVFSVWPYTEA